MDLVIFFLGTELDVRHLALDLAAFAWSIAGVFYIRDDVCTRGAGAALAGVDGAIALCVFTIPSYLIVRRRGMEFIKATLARRSRASSDVLSVATVIICAVGFLLDVAVIIDQAHYLCPSGYLR
jgi:hypothetical protein